MPKLLSLVELERMLDERAAQVLALLKKRDVLQEQLNDLDQELQEAANLNPAGRKTRKRQRMKNEMPLRKVVLQVLGKYKKGLTLAELSDKVTGSGYQTGSSNFKNVVYQCLYNTPQINYDATTGRYALAGE